MSRVDLYTTVHKGIRAVLFDTAKLVARADFTEATEAARAAQAVRRLLGFLHEHVEHEDDAIVPAVLAHAPELAAELATEHSRIEGMEKELTTLLARLEQAGSAERVALGQRLHERLGRLVGAQLAHLEQEESRANRVLWAHYGDDELRAIEERIVRSIPPERLAEWLELILPAASPAESGAMLAGMRAAMPAELFEALTARARRVLGDEAFARLLESDVATSSEGVH